VKAVTVVVMVLIALAVAVALAWYVGTTVRCWVTGGVWVWAEGWPRCDGVGMGVTR
jgi:uncharacterized membrane protein YgaE (UPF0421/DUF939 family)